MRKPLACLLALAFMAAFAACKGEPAPGAATAGAAIEETTIEATAIEEMTVDSAARITTAQAAPTGEAESRAVPTDTAGIIRYYNEALGKTPMRRTYYKRTMTKITGFAKALGITILDEPDLQDNPDVMPYVHYEDKASVPGDLVALEAGWVKDASIGVSGDTATLTVTMRDYAIEPGFDPRPGLRGYVSTLDRATVEPLVVEVSMALAAAVISPNALKEVNVTYSSYGQSNGKYVVAVDTATGRIKGLTFTGTQSVEGNAKCVINIPLIPASANAFVTLRGSLEAVYAPE